MKSLDARSDEVTTGVIISCVIIVIVLIMCPLLVRTVKSLTDDIQVEWFLMTYLSNRHSRTVADPGFPEGGADPVGDDAKVRHGDLLKISM